jgi:hypothetical protein
MLLNASSEALRIVSSIGMPAPHLHKDAQGGTERTPGWKRTIQEKLTRGLIVWNPESLPQPS